MTTTNNAEWITWSPPAGRVTPVWRELLRELAGLRRYRPRRRLTWIGGVGWLR